MIELSVQVKNTETSMTDKSIDYEAITVSRDDAKLVGITAAAKERFLKANPGANPSELDVWVRVKMMM